MNYPGPEEAPLPTPREADGPRAPGAGPRDLSLWDFIDPLAASWQAIAIAAVIGGVLAFFFAWLQAPMYEAMAIVRVAESKTGDVVEAVQPENFRPLLENRAIATDLIREFSLVSQPAWRIFAGNGSPMVPDRFLVDHLNVEQVIGTNLLRVRVRMGDRQTAATVANELVQRGLDLNRRINQAEVVEARDYIKSQLEEAAQRVEGLKTKLLALKQDSQIDALKAESAVALRLRAGLLELQSSIEYERAFLARSEADLESGQQLLTTRRSIDRTPALMEAAKETAAGGSVLGLELTEEQVNEPYSRLQEQTAQSRAKLAGLEQQRRLLVEDKRLAGEQLPVLMKLYDGEVAIARLEAEYSMALKVYSDLAIRYEDARIRVGSRGAQLQLVDPAAVPSTRVSPRVAAITQLGVVLALLVACSVVLGRHFLGRVRPDP